MWFTINESDVDRLKSGTSSAVCTFVCVERMAVEIMSWCDAIHTRDADLWGIRKISVGDTSVFGPSL